MLQLSSYEYAANAGYFESYQEFENTSANHAILLGYNNIAWQCKTWANCLASAVSRNDKKALKNAKRKLKYWTAAKMAVEGALALIIEPDRAEQLGFDPLFERLKQLEPVDSGVTLP